MKLNLKNTSLLVVLLLFLISCGKDYLDVHPTEVLTQEQIAEASEHNPGIVAGSMSGIYTLMFQEATGGSDSDDPDHDDFGQKGYDIYTDLLSGDMALAVNTYDWYKPLTEFQPTTDYTFNDNYFPWRYYYRIIRSANNVIDFLGGTDITPELDENKFLMGQAKAIRAHSYFYLTQLFSNSYNPANEILPIYKSALDQNGPKATTEEVFNFIQSDLNEAIVLLNGFARTGKHQIDQDVAKGILAYVYAAMGKNTEAMLLSDEIIDSGRFPLTTEEETLGGFNDVNTPSWMWGVDITLDNGLDLISWWGQMDIFTYSYAWAGDRKAIDLDLYNAIPDNDVRKQQFFPNSGSVYYLQPFNKFYDPDRILGGQRNIETDYIYMRVDEMYLLNAETAAKSGDETKARERLKNLLELRIPDNSYVDGLSGSSLLQEIQLQSRIELWGEGKSYLAMKRNQRSVLRGANHLSFVGVSIPYDDERLTFEIPRAEIDNNPFINTQN